MVFPQARRFWLGPLAVIAALGGIALTAPGPLADIVCIYLRTPTGNIALGVDRAYLTGAEGKRGGQMGSFMAHANWANLQPAEMTPNMFGVPLHDTLIAGSFMVGGSGNGAWPSHDRENRFYTELESELPGFRKVIPSPGSTEVRYLSAPVTDIDAMWCAPPRRGPIGKHTCQMYARVGGTHTYISFPLSRLTEYPFFFARANDLVARFTAAGKSCQVKI